MNLRYLGMASIVILAFGVLGGVFWWSVARPVQSAVVPVLSVVTPQPTVVCGKFAAPPLLVGTPITVSADGSAVAFDDGYLLQLKEIPSMYIGKRALFQITDGVVVNYGLVAEDYNPCPVK